MNRRGFLGGVAAALMAPAIIRTPNLLMPVRSVFVQGVDFVELSRVTRAALVPVLFVDIYQANPLLSILLERRLMEGRRTLPLLTAGSIFPALARV